MQPLHRAGIVVLVGLMNITTFALHAAPAPLPETGPHSQGSWTPLPYEAPWMQVSAAAFGASAGGSLGDSCQQGCDAVWNTCVGYAEERYQCCLSYCAGPGECSLCPFWRRTDVLICSYQRLCCILEGCQGYPPGSCGKGPRVTGQSPPDACIGI